MIASLRARRSSLSRREAILGYLYISPWLAGLVIFTAGPIVASAYLSLTEYRILVPPRFIGLDNYTRAVGGGDAIFWRAVYNTTYYAVLFVPLSIAGSLAAALLLNVGVRGQAAFRTMFFIPSITPAVAAVLLWIWFLSPEFGPLNSLLRAVGIEGPPWLGSPDWSKPALILMSLWGAVGGTTMIIFLAGLQGIPAELYEAAEIDGANAWQGFVNVTLPLLSPAVFFNLVVGMIAAFRVFTAAFVATGGGPLYSTMFYMLHLFNNAFVFLHMGYASALAWLFVLLVLALVVVQVRMATRWVYYEGEVQR
ncbi:MAG TPA: sugar ABC transporter permease [Chloroflexota bacterium]|nr:sugar ABC transporter permease [Chloroflexota bacterium]